MAGRRRKNERRKNERRKNRTGEWAALRSLRDRNDGRPETGGVVAVRLNHRLIALNPPGST
jgi:hypothetical protein